MSRYKTIPNTPDEPEQLNGYARRVIGVLSRKFDQEAEARFAARIRERDQTCSAPIATTSLRDK